MRNKESRGQKDDSAVYNVVFLQMIQSLPPMSNGSQPLVIPVSRELMPSSGQYVHMHMHRQNSKVK